MKDASFKENYDAIVLGTKLRKLNDYCGIKL